MVLGISMPLYIYIVSLVGELNPIFHPSSLRGAQGKKKKEKEKKPVEWGICK